MAYDGPRFVSVGTRLTGGSSTTAAVPVPAGVVAGSFVGIWLWTYTVTGGVFPTLSATPSGFQQDANSPQSSSSQGARAYFYWKIASGSDSGTYGFTINYNGGSSPYRTGVAFCYENTDQTTPIEASTGAHATANATYPGLAVTTLGANRTLLWLGGDGDGDNLYSCTPPAGFTVRYNANPDASLTVVDKNQPTQGASGTVSATQTGGSSIICEWLGALKPPASAPNTTNFFAMF